MVVDTQDSGSIIKLRAKESISGSTVEVMKGAGLKIICTGKASTLGKMAEGMQDNTREIGSMVSVSIHGLMAAATKECGVMVANMAKANTLQRLVTYLVKEFGRKENVNSGCDLK